MSLESFRILYEDTYIIVCVKPSGIATQSKSIKSPDMVSILKNHIAKNASSKNIPKEPYLGIIHRLDQPVQGIMVFAKTPFAAKELNKELLSGGFGKYYRALIAGRPPKDSDTLENYMQKDAKNNISCICKKGENKAKFARLSYKTVSKDQQYFSVLQSNLSEPVCTELDIHLHTGRHHQIRLQLTHIGCPIIGDTKYNPENAKKTDWHELKLCSYRLEFMHPKTRKPLSFSLI
ncbi:MAG: RNA pseudouridine synthase [Dorea sp.]|jgi:23S rRNA pseudouridine1911/1915/1917 synthase|nr:RNA pseudouridine synthase [Dorea sp.]